VPLLAANSSLLAESPFYLTQRTISLGFLSVWGLLENRRENIEAAIFPNPSEWKSG
jgi:hypothetical protein